MPHDRFFIEGPYDQGKKLTIEGDEFHHLTRVMRVKEGDALECFNGQGALAQATLVALQKKAGEVLLEEVTVTPKPVSPLTIVQAIPRMNRLDIILEKGTELGMNALWLFAGERSEKLEISPTQLTRMKNLLISACKQCGELWLPEIQLLAPLKQWEPFELPTFYGNIDPAAPLFAREWFRAPPQKGALFVVGPEKGFSDNEERDLEKRGAIGVKLHPHILRTDTAPLAALALMSHWLQMA